jgi:hypothetical protein
MKKIFATGVVDTILAVHLHLRKSPREKFQNGPIVIFGGAWVNLSHKKF